MHYRLNLIFFEYFIEQVFVIHGPFEKWAPFNRLPVTTNQIVKNYWLVTVSCQPFAHMRADIACTTNNEYFHYVYPSETFAKHPLLPNFCVKLNILHAVKL